MNAMNTKRAHGRCHDCDSGEHESYDDNVQLVIVRDPDSKRIVKRAYLCQEHRAMYQGDGYDVENPG